MKIPSLLLALFLWFGHLQAQSGCDGFRYLQEVFPTIQTNTDLTYGSNFNLLGQQQSLELDIYQPAGDSLSARPLIVWEHGGSFIGGSKNNMDIVPLAEAMTRLGYVNASIEYRLGLSGLPPDSADASEAVFRAVADMKAAVRWFYKSAREGNPYHIDTNHIYVGGVSAGGIAAAHYVYLDEISELPSFIDTTDQTLGGGLEGFSGNLGYPSEVQGAISISGMIADTAWMKPGDQPIVSVHGTADGTVPYGTATINLLSPLLPIMVVDGSGTLHQKADEIGIPNCLYTFPDAGHTPHVGNAAYLDTTLAVIKNFMAGLVCSGSGSCSFLVAQPEPNSPGDWDLFPNPCKDQIALQLPEELAGRFQWTILDLTGRRLNSGSFSGYKTDISTHSLPNGSFWLQLSNPNQNLTKPFRVLRL